MPIHSLILDFIYAYIACLAFTLIYNMRGKFVLLAPSGGSIAWIIYNMTAYTESDLVQNFIAIMAVSFYSEVMARIYKAPVTMFLVVGLLPLVPGAGIYYTSYYLIMNDLAQSMAKGIETFKIAGAIVLGMVFGLMLPQSWFNQLGKIGKK